ncbi:MAG: dual specificity protein phosphatase family protein [Candidatus Omnitrophica bacterium]|nr:dual specificity protein phosphatase family protein [Candidatus Omnitrophota bacterium]
MKVLLVALFFCSNLVFSWAGNSDYEAEVSFPQQIFNFHFVAPGIMRGSQPSREALKSLRDYAGIKTILSLKNSGPEEEWEEEAARDLGMVFLRIPMDASKLQPLETIDRCLEIISNKENHPVFVHCQAGKDRTGLIFAAYRIQYDSWDPEDALSEMLSYGYDRSCCFNMERSLMEWNERRTAQSLKDRS